MRRAAVYNARMRRLPLLLSFALLPAAPAWADPEKDAVRLLDEGFEAFKKGDPQSLEKARTDFEQASMLFPEKANPYRLLGLTNARLGRCDEAVKNIETFLKLAKKDDPRIPEVITVRDQCRARFGTLSVDSTPPGAEVRLDAADGLPIGVTPWKSEAVLEGPHRVFVGKDGFTTLSQAVTVDRRAPATVEAKLVAQGVVAPSPSNEGGHRRAYFIIGGVALVVLVAVIVGVAVAAGNHAGGPFATAIQFPEVTAK